MAIKWEGKIARWLARRAHHTPEQSQTPGEQASGVPAASSPTAPTSPQISAAQTAATQLNAPSPDEEAEDNVAADDSSPRPGAEQLTEQSTGQLDDLPPEQVGSGEATGQEIDGANSSATIDDVVTPEELGSVESAQAPTQAPTQSTAEVQEGLQDRLPTEATTNSSAPAEAVTGGGPQSPSEPSRVADPGVPGTPGAQDYKVITLVRLVEHSGAATLATALSNRAEAKDWQIRSTGPGLTRAAFSGMLADTDALLVVAPADAAFTSDLDKKLHWLEANNRPELRPRTIFVINLGTGTGEGVELPADLDRPLVFLPFDPALALGAGAPRVPRRAARRALDQLVDEISTILEES